MVLFFQKGGILMWPLLVLSFVSVTFIIERALYFWRLSLKRRPRFVHLILSNAERGRYQRAESLARRAREDYVARTLLNGLAHRNYSLTQALETQALIELEGMKKHLPVLDTMITAAPLFGILGTVIGIISSFEILGSRGVSDPLSVTQGISVALITTAYGLMIALGTLMPYNYFQSRYQKAARELESFCSILELVTQRQASRGKITTESES